MKYKFRKPDNSDREEQTVGDMLLGFILGLIACLLITMCSSCTTTKYVTVPEYHTDTVMVNKVQKDSVFLHDSTYVYEKGDTFYTERWHTKYVLKELHDTTYISKRDTIPAPYPVEKEVPAELTWWQQTRLHIANILLYLLAICGVIWIVKTYIKKFLP
jgi:hypothetical protein